jgi:mRNA interferase MazF
MRQLRGELRYEKEGKGYGKVEPDAQNGLEKTSAADTFQVGSVAEARFVRKLGRLDARLMDQITAGLGLVMEIE